MFSTAVHPSKPPRVRRDPRAGFTIVEVGVAALILGLVISSSLITMQRGFVAIDNARYTTLAAQILQSQMEKLRLLTWSQLTTASGHPTTGSFSTDISTTASGQLSNFVLTQTIEDAGGAYDTSTYKLKKITLTAQWKGSDGRSRSLSYFTYYGQNGVSDFFYTTH